MARNEVELNKTEELVSVFAEIFYRNAREEEAQEWIDDHYEPLGSEWVIGSPVAFWDEILKACKESGLVFSATDENGDRWIEEIDV